MQKGIGIKFLSWTYIYINTPVTFLGKHVIQTNPSRFDEMLFLDGYLCRLRLKQGREIQDFMFEGREFQRERERERER